MAVTIAMATARLSWVFVALCDRCGKERDSVFEGASVIVDERGWPVAAPLAGGAEGVVFGECRLERARDKWLNEWNDVLADRRPESYASLSGGPSRPEGSP